MDSVILWGAFLIMTLGTAVGLGIFLYKENRETEEGSALEPLLGVAEAPEERVWPHWIVPLSPIEDEEAAWEADRERRRDMEKNA